MLAALRSSRNAIASPYNPISAPPPIPIVQDTDGCFVCFKIIVIIYIVVTIIAFIMVF